MALAIMYLDRMRVQSLKKINLQSLWTDPILETSYIRLCSFMSLLTDNKFKEKIGIQKTKEKGNDVVRMT